MKIKNVLMGIAAGFAGLIILIAAFGASYTVDQGELAIQLRNGKVTGVAQPGLHFKLPFFEDAKKISTRQQKLVLENISSYSSDRQPTREFTVSITYSVNADQVTRVYSEYGTINGLQDRVLAPNAQDNIKAAFGKFTAIRAIQQREALGDEITTLMRKTLEREPAITVTNIQIEALRFSQAYEDSVEKQMITEVQVGTSNQQHAIERVNKEISITQAQARAESALTEAQAEAEAIRLRGEAEAQAIRARGDALRENQQLVQLIQAEKWNGVLPQTMVPGSAVPFINVR